MEDNILRINDMLLSEDAELRELGRVALKSLPEETGMMDKVFLFCNANEPYVCLEAVKIFKNNKLTQKDLANVITTLSTYGFNNTVAGALRSIEAVIPDGGAGKSDTLCSAFFGSEKFVNAKKKDYDMTWKKS